MTQGVRRQAKPSATLPSVPPAEDHTQTSPRRSPPGYSEDSTDLDRARTLVQSYSRFRPRAMVAPLRPSPRPLITEAQRLRGDDSDADQTERRTFLDAAIKRYPRNPELRLLRAVEMFSDEQAVSLLEVAAAVTLDRNNPATCFRAASLLRELGYTEDAHDLVKHITEIKPANFVFEADLASLDGLLSWDAGDSVRAEHRLRAALELEPTNEVSARNLMKFFAATGRREDALAVVETGARALATSDWVRELARTIAEETPPPGRPEGQTP